MTSGGQTPEELETLLEDSFVLRDGAGLARLFERGGVLVLALRDRVPPPGSICAMGDHKERMLSGELYWYDDPELVAEREHCQRLVERYNAAPATEHPAILTELFGHVGEGAAVNAPLRCDYGYRVSIGTGSFVNYDAVLLDCGGITIGNHVQIGPRVQLLTPLHPLDPDERREPVERGLPITIGDDVWLAGGVIVCPGVTIGAGTVVGAGSVVTRDLPGRVLAVGNPCRVLRKL